jgi:hypothetical protein
VQDSLKSRKQEAESKKLDGFKAVFFCFVSQGGSDQSPGYPGFLL